VDFCFELAAGSVCDDFVFAGSARRTVLPKMSSAKLKAHLMPKTKG